VRGAETPRIVLVGCSFAGLEFLYRYVRARRHLAPGELTVVEPRSHHPYIPLSHEAASGVTPPESLRFDIEALCASVGVTLVRSAAVGLDTRARLLDVEGGATLPYDQLIIAIGSEPAVPAALAEIGLVPAKWLADALELHERIRTIHLTTSAPARITVVGSGITSVEWASELAGNAIAGRRAAVTLVGQESRVLANFPPNIADRAATVLGELGIRCMLRSSVGDVAADAVVLDGGERIETDVTVWAGGVRPNELVRRLGLPLTPAGQVAVTARLAVPNVPGVYAIGDAARVVEGGAPWPTMERAIEAIWQGALLARRLAARWPDDRGPRHRLRRDFFYGLSLGPDHSLVLYGRWWVDSRIFVHFRRWLKWAYYARFRLLAVVVGPDRT
jgi:NADH:quinone reductase (non-electrogenic)